jgi:integrase
VIALVTVPGAQRRGGKRAFPSSLGKPDDEHGVKREDLERLVESLDKKVVRKEYSWRSASRIWLAVGKLFKDAGSSKNLALRVRKDTPALGVAPPDRGAEKSKTYLYPNEFLQLVSCEKVPLDLRRLTALAVYLYARASEILQLRWSDINLEQGVAHIRRSYDRDRKQEKATKNKRPRGFRIEPNLLPLLRALYAARDESGFVIRASGEHMARRFRFAMRTAGLDRPDLYIADELHKRMTFHDLRATGITWMVLRGDTPLVIQHRAGHLDFDTTQLYIREGEALRGDVGEVFPPLPASLLGPAGEGGNLSGNLSSVPSGARQVSGFSSKAEPVASLSGQKARTSSGCQTDRCSSLTHRGAFALHPARPLRGRASYSSPGYVSTNHYELLGCCTTPSGAKRAG